MTQNSKKLKVGQAIYLKPLSNAARRSTELVETTVTKVGNKYFEVDNVRNRFHISTLMQDNGDYSPNYQAYLTKQEILDEQERYSLYNDLMEKVKWTNPFTLDQLRQITKIINSHDTRQ